MNVTDLRHTLERLSRPVTLLGCVVLMLAVGVVDYLTGNEIAFSLFYLLPIAWAAWRAGFGWGVAVSVLSAAVWLLADAATGQGYSRLVVPVWNTLIRLSFFLIVTALIAKLTQALERERQLARVDALTGAFNSRHFYEVCEREIARSRRYGNPFTLMIFDLDGFKRVNDEHGHAAGDRALQIVSDAARQHFRAVDVVARMGGDEFAILMPQTELDAAEVASRKLLDKVRVAMQAQQWPVTLSVGLLGCAQPPASTDEAIRLADRLMYEAKRAGKNRVVARSSAAATAPA